MRARDRAWAAASRAERWRPCAELPAITAVRVGHHPAHAASARLFVALGFMPIGEKVDHETGTRDVLRELDLGRPSHASRSIP